MKHRYLNITLLGLAITLLSSSSFAQDGKQIMKKTVDLYGKAKSIKTVMTTKSSMKMDGKTRNDSMKLVSAYQQPDKFHFVISQLNGKAMAVIVSNGTLMTVYDAKKNTYFQIKPSAQAGPQAPVAGKPEQTVRFLAELFPATPKVKSVGSNYVLTNTSTQANDDTKQNLLKSMTVDKASGQIRSISVDMTMSSKSRSMVTNQIFTVVSQSINSAIPASEFKFVVPSGAKKIEPPKPPTGGPGGPGKQGLPGGPGR
ncbi:MAG: LolA family protein [Armatimonadota bacterium]